MVDDWLTSQMDVIPQNDLSRLIEREYDYVPLSRLIDEENIITNLRGTDRYSVLDELTQHAWNNKLIVSKAYLLEHLIHREKITSTALGRGVAIPHLRKPNGKIINEPKMVIGSSKSGIDFGSHDGMPTYIFFLILSDSEVVHLRILSKLTRILQMPAAIETMKSFLSPREYLRFFIEQEKYMQQKELGDD
jgi:PTS system nitrogen regulatory IIA component